MCTNAREGFLEGTAVLKCTTSPGSDQILKKRVSITFSVPAESVAQTTSTIVYLHL